VVHKARIAMSPRIAARKTYFGLALAYAIATGGDFLAGGCAASPPVLYVDGDGDPQRCRPPIPLARGGCAGRQMAIRHWRQPTSAIPVARRSGSSVIPRPVQPRRRQGRCLSRARLLTPMSDSSTTSTLCHSGIENDAESLGAIQRWLVSLPVRRHDRPAGSTTPESQEARNGRATNVEPASGRHPQRQHLLFKKLTEWGRFPSSSPRRRGFKPPDEFVVLIAHDKDGWPVSVGSRTAEPCRRRG